MKLSYRSHKFDIFLVILLIFDLIYYNANKHESLSKRIGCEIELKIDHHRSSMCCRFNSVDAADYTPPQRRAASSAAAGAVKGRAGAAAAAASGTTGSGSLVAPLISIDMCR